MQMGKNLRKRIDSQRQILNQDKQQSVQNLRESTGESVDEGKYGSQKSWDFLRNNSNMDLQPIYGETDITENKNYNIKIEWKKTGNKFIGSSNPISTLTTEQGPNTQRDHIRRSISSLD